MGAEPNLLGWVLVVFSTLLVGMIVGIALHARRFGRIPEPLLPVGLIFLGSLFGALNVAIGYPDNWVGYGLIVAQVLVSGIALVMFWPILKRNIRGS